MQITESIFLGILQGITEWFPISSSGHLVIVQELLNIEAPIFFDVLLHLATVLVIIIFFRKEILQILKEFPNYKKPYGKLGYYILIGTIPIGLVGFFFQDYITSLFSNLKAVGVSLVFTGLLLFLTKFSEGKRNLELKDSIIIGLSQALAILPGLSRSGATISSGMLLGLEKKQLVTFSFLLVIPAIIGATILEFNTASIEISYLYGFIASFIVGYITLKLLTIIIEKDYFHYFAYYCLILGILLLIF